MLSLGKSLRLAAVLSWAAVLSSLLLGPPGSQSVAVDVLALSLWACCPSTAGEVTNGSCRS